MRSPSETTGQRISTSLTRKRANGQLECKMNLLVGAAGLIMAGIVGTVSAGMYFARRILTPAQRPESGVAVWAVEMVSEIESPAGMNVWLTGPDADLVGAYSFIFDNRAGHARLGPEIDRVQDGKNLRIKRTVLALDRGELRAGSKGRVTGWWYTKPEEFGQATQHVRIAAPKGELTGWVVTPQDQTSGRWAIHVHGRGALPEETLRGLPPMIRAGVTNLVINYRNDLGAPAGIRQRYGLGLAERHDVDAAIRWALQQGARRITLVGWSMGGTTVLLSATRGPYRGWIDGLVLDTPGIDWREILQTQVRLVRAPTLIAKVGKFALQHNLVRGANPEARGTDVDSLNPHRFARDLTQPVLIHAGPEDTFVPWGGAQQLAILAPDLVELREAAGEHVKVWNVDPLGWEAATEKFVRGLADPPATLVAGDHTHENRVD